uniref:Uncharacterized protein n=1 Tax=Pyrodinium bahamense TaxID=73915 RepID=A0A7S0B723_9DINO|mmetsp:Transcript_51782/g.143362  ORF Transcript_51782/g.143362 Transcript_51782/m.143362 type:complete len:260 (+) Transcript_51782:90-869(+)
MEILPCRRQCLPTAAGATPQMGFTVSSGCFRDLANQTPDGLPCPAFNAESSSPPGAPRKAPGSALLEALHLQSVEKVQAALKQDSQAATQPFWDHNVEPPLCCAVRLGCSVVIVRLLLQYGANPDAADAQGRTPLGLLAARHPATRLPAWAAGLGLGGEEADDWSIEATCKMRQRNSFQVAQALVGAGADPMAADCAGIRPLDLAFANGLVAQSSAPSTIHLRRPLPRLTTSSTVPPWGCFGHHQCWPTAALRPPPCQT